MSCFYPQQALRLPDHPTKKGKIPLVFIGSVNNPNVNKWQGHPNLVTGLPCGQCAGCRLERSRQWAIRMMDEASLHDKNCFITLTFDDEHLNARENPMSLDKPEFQKFMKRLRKRLWNDHKRRMKPILLLAGIFSKKLVKWILEKTFKSPRYYMCGEYGEQFKRPHYHAILFGVDFPDKKLEKVVDGKYYFSSRILRELWPFGNNIITSVSFDTCAYVARYIMKKHLGKDAWLQYFEHLDLQSGELFGHRLAEYTTMSRRPGIGKAWIDKYLPDVYPRDKKFLKDRGYCRPPKYYDSQYEIVNPSDFARIKQSRVEQASKCDNSLPRLLAKEKIKKSQITVLKRNLE